MPMKESESARGYSIRNGGGRNRSIMLATYLILNVSIYSMTFNLVLTSSPFPLIKPKSILIILAKQFVP